MWPGLPGARRRRHALAQAFVAKNVFNLPTTLALIERLTADPVLRRSMRLGGQVRGAKRKHFLACFRGVRGKQPASARPRWALIQKTHKDRLVGHISRDATAIEAREKPVKCPSSAPLKAPEAPAAVPFVSQAAQKRRGRSSKKEPRRLERANLHDAR